jgi:hypothetical protein
MCMEFKARKDPPTTLSRSTSDTGLVNGEEADSSGPGTGLLPAQVSGM